MTEPDAHDLAAQDLAGHLADVAAIEQLKARYFYFMDTKQWDGLRSLFADDCEFDPAGEGEYQYTGVDDFMRAASSGLQPSLSVHHGHMPIVEHLGNGEVAVIWGLMDYVEWAAAVPAHGYVGYGHYHERYRRVGDDWRICSWKITRLRFDALTSGDHP